jgi:tetratricopeptide (TPR) repeat protein
MVKVKDKDRAKSGAGSELIENPEVIAEQLNKTEKFIEKNKRWVFIGGGAIAAVVAAFFLYRYFVTNQNTEAHSEMFQAVYYFEADSLDRALNGDGNNLGVLQIIEDYPLTDAANLARYYAGASLLKKGEYIAAVDHLKKFNASDLLVQARAYALIGDAYMEMQNYAEAVDQYEKAAAYKSNEHTTPLYLLKAGTAYELLEDWRSALTCYDKIVENYVNSGEYQEARKHRARVAGLIDG